MKSVSNHLLTHLAQMSFPPLLPPCGTDVRGCSRSCTSTLFAQFHPVMSFLTPPPSRSYFPEQTDSIFTSVVSENMLLLLFPLLAIICDLTDEDPAVTSSFYIDFPVSAASHTCRQLCLSLWTFAILDASTNTIWKFCHFVSILLDLCKEYMVGPERWLSG